MSKVFLYHKDCPAGKMFDVNMAQEKFDKLEDEGWVDTPAKLDLPKEKHTTLSQTDVDAMSNEAVIGVVRDLGFLVMTPEELEAELNKARSAVAVERGQVEDDFADQHEVKNTDEVQDDESQVLEDFSDEIGKTFDEDPKSMTKEELVEYGNAQYDLGLTRNMREDTLIDKIKAARGTK